MSREGPEMPDVGWTRASDRDREATVAELRAAYAAGRLNLGELEDRAGAAYAARTWSDLRQLTADLPAWMDQVGGPDRPGAWPTAGGRRGRPGRPFAPMGLMGALWIAIAVAARVPAAAIPLVMLAMFALWAACWRGKNR